MKSKTGKVYLVGAGPGDPGLLTRRGAEVLSRAEVVLYDALASTDLLDLTPEECERIYVGKRAGSSSTSQETINQLLLRHARQGRIVVRLKGGDPYVFGRGGEEAQACARGGVDFEVVSGVTSALAVPAAAGIPVLHRNYAGSVIVIQGRARPRTNGTRPREATPPPEEKAPQAEPGEESQQPASGGIVIRRRKRSETEEYRLRDYETAGSDATPLPQEPEDDEMAPPEVDWNAVCRAADTIVVLMFMSRMEDVRDHLLEGGRAEDQPVAAISCGTLARQRTVVSTIREFPDAVREAGLVSPSLLVVGEVVRLRDELCTFEKRPLFGRRVILTGPDSENIALSTALTEEGAEVHSVPAIRATPLANSPAEMRVLQESLKDATHAIFTRPEVVRQFLCAAEESGIDLRAFLLNTRILGTDETVIRALMRENISATLAQGPPDETGFRTRYGAEFDKSRVVVVEGEDEWGDLADDLQAAGAHVTEVPVRSWQPDEASLGGLYGMLERGRADLVVIESQAALRAMIRVWSNPGTKRLLADCTLATASGEVAEELGKLDLPVAVVAESTAPQAVAEALTEYFTVHSPESAEER